jgi:hypothetical protein
MRKTRTFVTVTVAALAAAVFVAAAPSLFARGDSGGGGGGGGASGGGARGAAGSDNPDNPQSGTSVGTTSSGTGSGKKRDDRADLPEFRRDGEEQREVSRDVVDRMARSRYRDVRDLRNRAAGEPRRDGERR